MADPPVQAVLSRNRLDLLPNGTYKCRFCGKRPNGLQQALAHIQTAAHQEALLRHRVDWRMPEALEAAIKDILAHPAEVTRQDMGLKSLTFCTVCVRRSLQLCNVLLCNAVTLGDSARRVSTKLRWCIVLAEDGEERGCLRRLHDVCGLRGTEELEVNVCFADLSATGGFFHSSFAKNTSHCFALHCIGCSNFELQDHILVNLDCDVILPPRFAESVLHKFRSRALQLLACRNSQAATTGRLAIRASAFVEVQGYDQEPDIQGAGYQDVDLHHRVGIVPFADDGSIRSDPEASSALSARSVGRLQAADPALGGWALPNTEHEFATEEDDRRLAKVKHVHNPRNLNWDEMNEENRAAMFAKRKRPASYAWKRNVGLRLGWPFVQLHCDHLALAWRNPGRMFDAHRPLLRSPPASIGSPPGDAEVRRASCRFPPSEDWQDWHQDLSRAASAWMDNLPESFWIGEEHTF